HSLDDPVELLFTAFFGFHSQYVPSAAAELDEVAVSDEETDSTKIFLTGERFPDSLS
ncbi:hypothetical protein A2U01_0117672, partial [Trifolium medium]|nr:hypothetical protein [Trifolium medium]